MEVWVLSGNSLSLFPNQARLTLDRFPVELHQLGLAIVSDQAEGMDTESIHESERSGNPVSSHSPEQGLQGTGLLAEEIPSRIMRACSLRDFVGWVRFHGMDKIWEQDCILDEEGRDVVSNNICENW